MINQNDHNVQMLSIITYLTLTFVCKLAKIFKMSQALIFFQKKKKKKKKKKKIFFFFLKVYKINIKVNLMKG